MSILIALLGIMNTLALVRARAHPRVRHPAGAGPLARQLRRMLVLEAFIMALVAPRSGSRSGWRSAGSRRRASSARTGTATRRSRSFR
jgi:hypothetical protein